MKNILLVIFPLLLALHSFGQKNQQLKAYLDHKVFFEPTAGNYVEIQVQLLGYSLKYKPVEGGHLQAEVAVQMIIRSGDKIMASDAYRLQSPIMRDSVVEDFFDLKRFALPAGMYELEISLQDLNADNDAMTGKQMIEVKDLSQVASVSDLQISESMKKTQETTLFTKSGYEMIPRISNFYATEASVLPVYLELYNPGSKESFGVKQTISYTKNNTEIDEYTRFSKHEVDKVQPIVRAIDISKLPSGEFTLAFSLISKDNKEIAKSEYYFERTNDVIDEISAENVIMDPAFQASITDDSVSFYLESLIPISGRAEVKNIIKILKKDTKEMQRKYIQAYWVKSAGVDKPYDAWMKYKEQVQMVQKFYASNFMNGFETDRGRVYLQYGPPNNIIVRETSPSDYPYEIWQYDKIKRYSNKKFIFYNPDLVNNAYRLLHSDMIGELQNYRWQQQLSKRNSPNRNIDDPNDGNKDHWGGNSRELFQQH